MIKEDTIALLEEYAAVREDYKFNTANLDQILVRFRTLESTKSDLEKKIAAAERRGAEILRKLGLVEP